MNPILESYHNNSLEDLNKILDEKFYDTNDYVSMLLFLIEKQRKDLFEKEFLLALVRADEFLELDGSIKECIKKLVKINYKE